MTTGRHITEDAAEWSGRVTAADVHGVMFTRSGLGRRGYDEVEVDEFLDRVQVEIQRLTSEKSDLRDEAARLKRQVERAASAEPNTPNREEAAVQAVSILSAAQQTADQYVADAENYSRRLSSDAREQSESVVAEARARAAQIIADAEQAAHDAAQEVMHAHASGEGVTARTKDELEEQVAYLRTFSQVCRTQLRSYLEALLEDIELEWGKADPAALMSARELPAPHIVMQRVASEDAGSSEDSEGGEKDTAASDLALADVESQPQEVVLNGHSRGGRD